jgi:hypothetical protein
VQCRQVASLLPHVVELENVNYDYLQYTTSGGFVNNNQRARRFFSLLDMPFLFCYRESIWRSMLVFSWFVEQLMRNEIVKMVLLSEIH